MSLPGHVVPLPGTDWTVWRHALLRSTGFPVAGLRLLCAPDAAGAADDYLDGELARADFDRIFAAAEAGGSERVRAIAADPLFREAVAWQNPSILTALRGLREASGGPANRRQRQRERVVARYWQRYCAKTETIGFFGPVCWITVDPREPALSAVPGPGLIRERHVYLEYWAIAEYARQIAGRPEVRLWLPPVLQPQLTLDGDQVIDPVRPPLRLSRAEAAVLHLIDGRSSARQIAQLAVRDGGSGLRKEADVCLLLDRLAGRGVIRWDFQLPVHRDCERMLRERIEAIGDPAVRARAADGLARLRAARERAEAAAGDPDAVARAVAGLESEFTAVTGQEPARKPGQMYAARRIYWEEATRDLTLTVGRRVIDAIAAPLAVLGQIGRWLSAEVARAYLRAIGDLYQELAGELGSAEVPLGQLWSLAQGLFYGRSERPLDEVAADLSGRLAALFGLTGRPAGEHEVRLASAGLRGPLRRCFPAARPGWPDARLHSPDLQICAASGEAIERGEFTVVLGEFHVAWATNSVAGAVAAFPRPGLLAAALAADLGRGQVRPLLPVEWPRNTPRLGFALAGGDDVTLGILPAPGADPGRLLPVSALSVTQRGGELVALAADGRSWPLPVIFARLLSEVCVEAFKLAGRGPHTPRVLVDRMVVARETWRTTAAGSGLAGPGRPGELFLAARRWRRELGLPERVFVKIGTEVKPVFVDFTGPLYVASLAHMLRAARTGGGDDVPVQVTEMLPGPDDAWLRDAEGQRYLSELRLHLRDPVPAGPPG